jgi:hypothetical protein
VRRIRRRDPGNARAGLAARRDCRWTSNSEIHSRDDAAARDSLTYFRPGDRAWAALASTADVVVPPNAVLTPAPATSAGACQVGTTNWGDPGGTSVCASYYPVIWAQGDVTINGGVGQGILIADGDVRLASGAAFSGLVIARDDIVTLGGGGRILGAALAGDMRPGAGDYTVVGSGSLVQYSSCALHSAVYASAPLIRVRQRAWAEFE